MDDMTMMTNEPVEEDIEGESKSDKFKRVANKRVNSAMKQIDNIGKLATSAYEYTPEQIEKIFDALQRTLDSTKAKFQAPEEFSL